MQNTYTKERDMENVSKDKSSDLNAALRQGEERAREVAAQVEKKIKQGQEQVRHVIADVDKKLHEKPWSFVAGVAVSFVLLGFMMGLSKKSR